MPAAAVAASSPAPGVAAPPSVQAANAMPLSPEVYDDIVKSAVDKALTKPHTGAAADAQAGADWKTVSIKRGQTLSTVFDSAGLPPTEWMTVLKLGKAVAPLRRLQVGDTLKLKVANGSLQALDYPYDVTHTLDVRRVDGNLQAQVKTAALDHRTAEATGVISNSLFVDGQRAGLNDQQILQLAHIFTYDIDFAQDLQAGDRFTVIYDEVFKNGKKLHNGNILAAEFVNQGHVYRAVRFVAKNGDAGYYTPSGQSLKRAFIRTPVEFTRISSGFSRARMNPVLHVVRPHFGTDYAAPTGTPVHVTGDGRIAFIGRDGGYGNCIKVQHGAHYESIYGHLSRFRKGLALGSKVKQGEVIGFVGMTGLATGPHLHYEFRVNGVPKNPVTVKLPRGLPLPPREMTAFHRETSSLMARINTVDSRQYADNGPTIGTR